MFRAGVIFVVDVFRDAIVWLFTKNLELDENGNELMCLTSLSYHLEYQSSGSFSSQILSLRCPYLRSISCETHKDQARISLYTYIYHGNSDYNDYCYWKMQKNVQCEYNVSWCLVFHSVYQRESKIVIVSQMKKGRNHSVEQIWKV